MSFAAFLSAMKKTSAFVCQGTPTKSVQNNDYCRICRCNYAILGRGTFNLFSGKMALRDKLSPRLSKVLGLPVVPVDGVSSVICLKCKREFEKYENYMKTLEVDLVNFRQKYITSVQAQSDSLEERFKRCHNIDNSPAAQSSNKRSCTITSPPKVVPQRIILPRPEDTAPVCPLPNHDDLIVATTPGTRTEVRKRSQIV